MKTTILLFLCVAILYVSYASESGAGMKCVSRCRNSSSFTACLQSCATSVADEDESESDWYRRSCSDKCAVAYDEESDINTCRARCFGSVRAWAEEDDEEQSESFTALQGQTIWESYAKQLFNFFKQGTDARGLQILRTPVAATWNTDRGQLTDFLNRMSNWGIEHDWNGRLFSQEYIAFLKNIRVNSTGPAARNPALEEAIALVEELQAQLEEDKAKCRTRFERFGRGATYEQFEARSCTAVEMTNFDLRNAKFRVQQLSGGSSSNDVQDAINRFESESGVWEWKETFVNTLASFLRKIQSKTADSFNIQISKSSSSKSNSTSEWSYEQLSKGNKTTEFISVANGTKHSFNTSTDSFKMDLTAEGYTAIQVGPAPAWYSANVVKKYANGPFKDTSARYFGKNGRLGMIPSTLYLLHKPVISLYLSAVDAKYLTTVKSSVTVGPFTVQASGISAKPTQTENVFQVNLEPSGDAPVIVAVENIFLPQ